MLIGTVTTEGKLFTVSATDNNKTAALAQYKQPMSKPISETISSTTHLDLPKTDSWGNEVGADGKPVQYLKGDPYADATAKHNGGVHVQEVRPTFEELNSIERHRREILLRVSVILCCCVM